MSKQIKPGSREFRTLVVERSAISEEARTVELSFSSETPYDRWWGTEILDHSPQSVRLGRLMNGGPALMDHNARDQVGVVESVEIAGDRVGRATIRFSKSARGQEVFQDVLDGIRRNVSVGYVIHKAVLQETKDGQETYRVTDWEPFEISLVSVPADPTVGVGRADEQRGGVEFIESEPVVEVRADEEPKGKVMTEKVEERKSETSDIINLGMLFKHVGGEQMARDAIASNLDLDAFRALVMEKAKNAPLPTAEIGMSEKEVRQYSFIRALHALANPNDQRAQAAAGFEFEASRAVAEKIGRTPQGLLVPFDVQKRDLTVGTATAGGHTVATNLLAQNFIELLRNAMVLSRLGVRTLSGLVGNIAIPRQTGGATAYWVAESGAPTESQQAVDQVAMSPKTVGAYTDISRKLLLQSSIDVEAFVRNDLAITLGLELERVAINGSGSGAEPQGILNKTGIGDVAGGTNGLAPTWAHIVELETDVAVANAAVGNMGYLTNAKVRGKMKTVEKASGTAKFLWNEDAPDSPVNGYRTEVTNAVPSNLTKGSSSGVCSAILFGNFADLVIGLWGGLDLTVDPYSNSTSGTVRVVALQDADIAVRHAESFAAMKDALTA